MIVLSEKVFAQARKLMDIIGKEHSKGIVRHSWQQETTEW